MATFIEKLQVAPPPAAAPEQFLPLTFFDIHWLPFPPIRRLFFYELPCCSKPYFLDTIVPMLRSSLSLTLKHFSPLAGRIVYPLSSGNAKPAIRYVPGDSICLSVFVSDKDFDALVGHHSRDCDQFYELIPVSPPVIQESDRKLLQVLALKVTCFPGRGICIGVANHHAAGDATSIVGFLKSWASVCKLGGDDGDGDGISFKPLTIFDKALIKDSGDVVSVFWNKVKERPFESAPFPLPTGRVRATYTFSQLDIKRLKGAIVSRSPPGFHHISSFVVTSAYIWTCLARALVQDEEGEVADDEPEYFLFSGDCRSRVDPPLPPNYFGNCLVYGLAEVRHKDLVGDDGLFQAAASIADQITNKLNNRERLLKGAENWMRDLGSVVHKRILSISGSARVDLYGLDFGWGSVRKLETLSIDSQKHSVSLCRDNQGGLEVGLSLPPTKMELFAAIFGKGPSPSNPDH